MRRTVACRAARVACRASSHPAALTVKQHPPAKASSATTGAALDLYVFPRADRARRAGAVRRGPGDAYRRRRAGLCRAAAGGGAGQAVRDRRPRYRYAADRGAGQGPRPHRRDHRRAARRLRAGLADRARRAARPRISTSSPCPRRSTAPTGPTCAWSKAPARAVGALLPAAVAEGRVRRSSCIESTVYPGVTEDRLRADARSRLGPELCGQSTSSSATAPSGSIPATASTRSTRSPRSSRARPPKCSIASPISTTRSLQRRRVPRASRSRRRRRPR